MRAAVVLFTRDLRVHDNPALARAVAEAETVLPLFVLDEGIGRTRYGTAAYRNAFLLEALADLDSSLRSLGAALDVRVGEVVAETVRAAREVGATTVFASADVSPYAVGRERRLAAELDLRLVDGTFVVPAGEVTPTGNDHYQVFSPYHRAWSQVSFGAPEATPTALRLPTGVVAGRAPAPAFVPPMLGGETAGVERAGAWLRSCLDGYGSGGHDAVAADATSRLSPYVHFGCVSARALAVRARERGGEAFVRQLCWRDFYAQILFAQPRTQVEDMRPRGDLWLDDPEALSAWKEGMTGYPLVDAGMRQLRQEGWMHNRARMVAASFLVKDLGIDWREGARHFFDLLLDGDVAQNIGNWQWVAGTGVDTRPNRIYNPTAQLKKLDPEGEYVRRYVPELADVPSRAIAEPGLLAPSYPGPIVDHGTATEAFRRRRGLD
ncbi:deoxyribodipyrimidine photo-lyase [Gaiella sp.]|uniref:cryptochrome/photolyase family protein n=1 Tax=Gaiella sp. TaxID=2663207 RepID=UPI003264F24D